MHLAWLHNMAVHLSERCLFFSHSGFSCLNITNTAGVPACTWDYNGQGLEYQILAGPIFILDYTFMGILVGFAADIFNRKNMLAVCLFFWSAMTSLTGLVTEYWQLVVLRVLLGMGSVYKISALIVVACEKKDCCMVLMEVSCLKHGIIFV